MSISDLMMWRYYELLTDVQVADIEKMKRDLHPMQAKKELALRIVADFHSLETAARAADDWAKQFQKDEVPEDAEEISIGLEELGAIEEQERTLVRMDRVLVKCGLADSATDAARKIKQGSVRVNNTIQKEPRLALNASLPARLILRVGKQLKIAVISP
jgi:tyrosyl-tRNA synthetase